MIGHWMGSIYGISGRRTDIRLSLGPDGRYEWKERFHNGQGRAEVGRWSSEEEETVLRLQPDLATDRPRRWSILAVTTCEDANTLLVLREVILASRNLPILFYRVHPAEIPGTLRPLSDRDRDLFLELIENPPEPNDAFRKASEAYRDRHGRDVEGGTQ